MAYNTAYLDELVAEYLTYRGFFASLKAFKQEQKGDKSKSFNVDKIVDFLLQLTTSGDLQLLRSTWSHLSQAIFSRLPDTVHSSAAQRLEAALYKLYLVHAFQNGKKDKIQEFFQTMSSTLIGNSDTSVWKDWLAFPYVTQPANQAPFAVCFTRPWQDSVTISLTNLLMVAFHLLPKPRLALLMEHISKLETDLTRVRDSDKDGVDGGGEKTRLSAVESMLPQNSADSLTRPSRRLLSFFLSNKNQSPAPNPTTSPQQTDSFRRSKSQSSFPRQQNLMTSSTLADIPTPENPEADHSRVLGIESETDDTVVIKRVSKGLDSDASAAEDAFDGGDADADADADDDDDDDDDDDENSATPKAGADSLSKSLPAQSFMEKVIDSVQSMTPGSKNGEANPVAGNRDKRLSIGLAGHHRKQGSTTKFTCLDTERAEVPGCHGTAFVRYSADGRFLGVLSHSAQSVFIFSADAVSSRGVVTSALVSSPPSCFCIGSLSTRTSDDDVTQLLVAVGSSTAGKLYVFYHTDSSIKTSKNAMNSRQLLLVPLEPGQVTKQYSVASVDAVPSQLDIAVAVVVPAEIQSKPVLTPASSQIYVVSLADLVVLRRVESNFNSSLSSCCCCPSLNKSPSAAMALAPANRQNLWLLACGDSSGTIYVSVFTHISGASQTVAWSSLKLPLFSKISHLQPLGPDSSASPTAPTLKLIVADVMGRFAICRVDASADASLTISLLSECDAFENGSKTTSASPSVSPDGQYAAVLFDSGASLFLVNVASDDVGDIVAQLPDSAERDNQYSSNSTTSNKNGNSKDFDFTCVAWTPSVLQTAFTYIAALTKSGDLLVFRLLT